MFAIFQCPPIPHLIVGGIASFRCGDVHMTRTLTRNFDLIYVVQGVLHMEENGQKYSLAPGQFLILPPNRPHRGNQPCTEDTLFYWIHFSTTGEYFLSESPIKESNTILKSADQYQKRPFHISLPQYSTIPQSMQPAMEEAMEQLSQVRIIRQQHSKKFFDSSIPQIQMQQQFLRILTFLCQAAAPAPRRNIAKEIYQYIQGNYRKDITLEQLAEHFAFHPAYIIRLLKKQYGQTPKQLILQLRLEEAAAMLSQTDNSIQSIAWDAGFEDAAYFAKLFRRQYGMTPREWRHSQSLTQ